MPSAARRLTETEVETSVDNDTNDGGNETSVETGNTVGSEGLLVDIDQTVELSGATRLGRLVVVGQSGSGVVERVDEEEGRSTSGTTLSESVAGRAQRSQGERTEAMLPANHFQ